jgi:hypothetical protein
VKHMAAFVYWLSENQVVTDGLECRPCEYGNGVFATKDYNVSSLIGINS